MKLKIRPLSGARATVPLALALALLVLIAGCSKDSGTGNRPEGATSNNVPTSASPPANTPSTANTSPPTSTLAAGASPTAVVKGYYEAGRRKDIAATKRFLSRESLQQLEDVAKRQGKTLDQLFVEAADREARKPPPLFSGEMIGGNTAFVDIKAPDEPLRTVTLVKEGGEWKLAFGKPKSGAIKR
jgi:hypothetical protein